MKAVRLITSIVSVLALSQCSFPDFPPLGSRSEIVRRPLMVMPSSASQPPLYVWHGGGQPGPLSLNIDLSEQKAYLFKNGESVGWTFVATGRSEFPTPTGSFRILEKIISKRSNLYGVIADSSGKIVNGHATAGVSRIPPGGSFIGSRMPYWMRLTGNGVGLHAGPIPRPGSPASHGCIRLPRDMAETIYQHASVGTQVTIMH